MWYQESVFKTPDHYVSDNKLEQYVCNLDLSRIRSTFAAQFNGTAQLPESIKAFGDIWSEDDWHIMYSLTIGESGELPILLFGATKTGECSIYKFIKNDGSCEDFDFKEWEKEMIRLSGIAQTREYYYDIENDASDVFHFFWENSSPFSQWHKCSFTALGLSFNSAEQYMMFQKAMLFEDLEIAEKILKTKDVRKQKELGRQVKGFNQEIWEKNCHRIVYNANKYKFSQNEDLLLQLFATQGKLLVEASPYDKIWGIGLSADDPRAQDKTQWLGTNLLGYLLTRLRDDLYTARILAKR